MLDMLETDFKCHAHSRLSPGTESVSMITQTLLPFSFQNFTT